MNEKRKGKARPTKDAKAIAENGKKAKVESRVKRHVVRKEAARKGASKGTAVPNILRDTIEKLVGTLFKLFTTKILQISSKKSAKSQLEKLYYALSSDPNDDFWFEAATKKELSDEVRAFCKIAGITSFAASRGVISTRRHTNTLEIEYLLLVPEWNAKFLQTLGSSDEFHLAIYWDSQTWPKYKIISDGLDDDQEGMRRVGGLKVYH